MRFGCSLGGAPAAQVLRGDGVARGLGGRNLLRPGGPLPKTPRPLSVPLEAALAACAPPASGRVSRR
eukprot:3186343-Pyramimonas_sp.AAC.1